MADTGAAALHDHDDDDFQSGDAGASTTYVSSFIFELLISNKIL